MRRYVAPLLAVPFLIAASAAVRFEVTAKNASTNKGEKPAKETAKAPVTPEMEADVMKFVELNHAELAELLHQLKATNPTQYQQAVRELSRAAATLANTQKNDPQKYALDLKAWQVNSQIQVIAARLAMSATPELKDALRAKLLEQIDLRLELQRLERGRTEARLKRIDDAITRLQESREQEASKAFDKLTRATLKVGPKKANKPADRDAKTEPQGKPTDPPK